MSRPRGLPTGVAPETPVALPDTTVPLHGKQICTMTRRNGQSLKSLVRRIQTTEAEMKIPCLGLWGSFLTEQSESQHPPICFLLSFRKLTKKGVGVGHHRLGFLRKEMVVDVFTRFPLLE